MFRVFGLAVLATLSAGSGLAFSCIDVWDENRLLGLLVYPGEEGYDPVAYGESLYERFSRVLDVGGDVVAVGRFEPTWDTTKPLYHVDVFCRSDRHNLEY